MAAIVCAISAPALAQGLPVTVPAGSADAALRAIYEADWAWRQQDQPRGPTADRLPKVDPATQGRRLAHYQETLAALDKVPVAGLSDEERINAAVLRASLQALIARGRARDYEAPMAAGASPWANIAPRQGFADAAAYRAYLKRMADVPRYLDEQVANMRAGLARGFTAPRAAILGREKVIEPFTSTDPDRNPYYVPFRDMPSGIPAAEQARLRAEARALITNTVAPAHAKLLPFVRDTYIPGARITTAAEALPDGPAYYRDRIREFVTYDWTPEQIHALGLKEVASIRADMERVMKASGWTGDFAGFLRFLKTDPQFEPKTPYDVIARTSYVVNRVNAKLNQTIGFLPRYRFTILPTPAAIAPFATGGNGGLDSCTFNTYNLPARRTYTLPVLAVHECSPGHSLQAAIALEGPKKAEFRRGTSFAGYGEGWGLYTEWLGIGMGVYETPYDEFGRLTYAMWRAARLVIDTGIHHYGWSRQRAIDYLSSNTALADHEVATEIDRYISEPGQALAYKIGEMTIRRKRAEAEAKLGDRFDQRWFHDKFLSLGPVPLPVLEQEMDRWIAAGGPDPHADAAPS